MWPADWKALTRECTNGDDLGHGGPSSLVTCLLVCVYWNYIEDVQEYALCVD